MVRPSGIYAIRIKGRLGKIAVRSYRLDFRPQTARRAVKHRQLSYSVPKASQRFLRLLKFLTPPQMIESLGKREKGDGKKEKGFGQVA